MISNRVASRQDQKIRYFGLKRNFLLHNWTIVILLIAKPCKPTSRVKGSFKSCSWFAWKWRQNFNQFFALLLRSAKNSLKTISLQTGCWVELSLSMHTVVELYKRRPVIIFLEKSLSVHKYVTSYPCPHQESCGFRKSCWTKPQGWQKCIWNHPLLVLSTWKAGTFSIKKP